MARHCASKLYQANRDGSGNLLVFTSRGVRAYVTFAEVGVINESRLMYCGHNVVVGIDVCCTLTNGVSLPLVRTCCMLPTNMQSLRKAFASLGRTPSTRTDGCSPPRRRYEPAQLIRTSGDGYKDGSNLEGTRCSPNNDLAVDHANIKKKSVWKRVGLNKSALDTHGTHSSQSAEGESNRSPQPKAALRVVEPEQDQVAKGTEPFGLRGIEETPPDSSWTFEAMLKEQRRKEVQHEAQRERTFQRVLSALGGPTGDAADLPPNVVSAWEARNEKLVTEAENTKLRQQKLKVCWVLDRAAK